MSRAAAEGLLSFLRPGILHELGNALFTIRGHAEVGAPTDASRAHIVRACQRAESALSVLRDLDAAAGEQDPVGLDVLVQRVVGAARVPLAERGLRIAWTVSVATPVDGAAVVPSLVGALSALSDRLPVGFAGEVRVTAAEVDGRSALTLVVAPDAGCLPFPLDLRAAAAEVATLVGDRGVQVACEAGLTLLFAISADHR